MKNTDEEKDLKYTLLDADKSDGVLSIQVTEDTDPDRR